jgi:uncharacterized protein YbjT (DUF2867 family)
VGSVIEARPGRPRVVVTGGAGLVGQNLAVLLAARTDLEQVYIDKDPKRIRLLHALHPDVEAVLGDLAEPGPWQDHLRPRDTIVVLHAQVTAKDAGPFERNTVHATRLLLDRAREVGTGDVIHVSSMIVRSKVENDYARAKKVQEAMVLESGLRCCVLRPTLMYGWFDPKHLGWLARFMARAPVFPIPGNGRFIRQPLAAMDLCQVIERCIDAFPAGQTYEIVGSERIEYVEILKAIREAKGLRRPFVHLPIPIFRALLQAYATVSGSPPFTADQLTGLTAGDEFEGVDLQATFGVTPTPFAQGIRATLTDKRYSDLALTEIG